MQGNYGQVEFDEQGRPLNVSEREVFDEDDFQKLLEDVIAHPETIETKEFSNEVLQRLIEKISPMKSIVTPINKTPFERVAACSIINMRESYMKRFLMTSLVEFLYKVYDEWDPDEELEYDPSTIGATGTLGTGATNSRNGSQGITLIGDVMADNYADALKGKKYEEITESLEKILHSWKVGTCQVEVEGGLSPELRRQELMLAMNGFVSFGNGVTKAVRHIDNENWDKINTRKIKINPSFVKPLAKTFLDKWFVYSPYMHAKPASTEAYRKLNEVEKLAALGKSVKKDVLAEESGDPEHINLTTLTKTINELLKELPEEEASLIERIRGDPKIFHAFQTVLHTETTMILMQELLDKINPDKVLVNYEDKSEQHGHGLDGKLRAAILKPEGYYHYFVPPQDTFARWAIYTEVNYEELRTITDSLYCDKQDVEFAIGIWDSNEGTEEEHSKWYQKLCDLNQESCPSSMLAVKYGGWTLLGDFKANRERISFYNKNTKILENIINRHTEDKKIGKELMKRRVTQEKAKEIRRLGPDSVGLKDYIRTKDEIRPNSNLDAMGAHTALSREEKLRLERAKGDIKAAHELEYLDEQLKVIAEYESKQTHTVIETEEYEKAIKNAKMAREMLDVPDNAIRVDTYQHDPVTGEFIKGQFFTMSDEAIRAEGSPAAQNAPPAAI